MLCVALVALVFLTFLPALQCDFQVNDEGAEVVHNAHVNTGLTLENIRWALSSMEFGNWYPLNWMSHMLDYDFFGGKAWGHHLTNLVLHSANPVLLFLVLKRMTGAVWRSVAVAALFAVHPLRAESVVWITERKDVLSTFFGLFTVLMYLRYAHRVSMAGASFRLPFRFWDYWLALVFFACSLMSKSMLVTLPVLFLLLDFWPLDRWRQENRWRLALEKVPFFFIAGLTITATFLAQRGGGMFVLHVPLDLRLETVVMNYVRYLGKMFWPANYSMLYPFPDSWSTCQWLLALVFILGLSGLAFALRHKHPYLLTGWSWYLAALTPVIGFIPLGWQSMANRYTYVPMIGILWMVVWTTADLSKAWPRRTLLMTALTLLVLSACILRTRQEIVYWKDSETLWRRVLAVTKNNYAAHWCLGNILYDTNRKEALSEFEQCVATYPGLPDYKKGEAGLAFLLVIAGHLPDSVDHYRAALVLDPENSWALNGLGRILYKMNRPVDAVLPLSKAVELEPQNAGYKDDLGNVLFSGDRQADAISNFLAMARLDPAGFDLCLAAILQGPRQAAFMNNLAWSFATNPDPRLRNGNCAVFLAEQTCQMTGYKIPLYVGTLASAYAEAGKYDNAVAAAETAVLLARQNREWNLFNKNLRLLELYRSHSPYHETPRP
jgi:tetratricopeptide (TPR) repeat protein